MTINPFLLILMHTLSVCWAQDSNFEPCPPPESFTCPGIEAFPMDNLNHCVFKRSPDDEPAQVICEIFLQTVDNSFSSVIVYTRFQITFILTEKFKILMEAGSEFYCISMSKLNVQLVTSKTPWNNVTIGYMELTGLLIQMGIQPNSLIGMNFHKVIPVGVVKINTTCWHNDSCPDCVNTLWFMNRVRNMADSLDPFNINFWQYLKTTVKEQFGIQLYKIDVTFLPNFGNFAITWLLNLLTGDLGLQELRVRNAEWEEVPHAFSHMPSLKTLDISRNQITKLPPGTFDGVKNITLLNLAENYLTFIPEGISRLEHLKTLDLSRNPILITDLNMLSNLHRLQRLNLAHIPIKDLNILHKYFRSSNELLDLNLSDCNISLVEYDDLFNYTFKKSLQVLDLSGNGFTVLPPKLFSPLTNLKYLNLSNNKFTEDLCLDLNGLSLDILDISQNILTNPTSVIVSDRVENINISYNNISIWRNQNACRKSSSSSNTLWITHMNLSYNYISYISDEMAQLLETLTGAVELEGNILDCDNCQIIEFQKVLSHHLSVKFLEFDSENLTCSLPLTMRGFPILDMTFPENHPCLLKSAEKSSYSYVLASGITLTSLMVLAIVLAGFAYRYRYEISYMTHLVGIQCQTQKITYEYEEDQSLKYDAFVCYSAEDRMWVKSELVPHLESEPFHYQLCLHERDFSLGTIITNNIVSAMCTSRGNVVILTNAFIQSHWCRWELEMANKRLLDDEHHFLILLELDRLDRTTLPRHLKYLMDTRTYLEWPMQDSSKDAKNILWRRLTEALGDSLHCKRMALQNNKNK